MSSSWRIQTTDDEKEFRETKFRDPSLVWKKKMICTSCGKSIKDDVIYHKKVHVHPILDVLWCKECEEFYFDGEFSTDEDGSDKYCRWCGNGGKLFYCSFCSTAFCNKCIRRNASIKLKNIRNDEWRCFVCSTKPVWNLRGLCDAAKRYVNARSSTQSRKKLQSDEDKLEAIAWTSHCSNLKRKRINSDTETKIHFDKKMKAKFESVVQDTIKESTTLHKLLARKKTAWKNDYFGIDITELNANIVDQFREEFTKFYSDIQTRIDQMKDSFQKKLDHLRQLNEDETEEKNQLLAVDKEESSKDKQEVETERENVANVFIGLETIAKEPPENFQSGASLVSTDGSEVRFTFMMSDDDNASVADTEAAVKTYELRKSANQSLIVNASSGIDFNIDTDEENELIQVQCYDYIEVEV